MSDLHITQMLLTARAEGELTEYEFQSLLLDHLRALCPHCKEELDRYSSSQRSPMPLVALTDFVSSLLSSLDSHREDLKKKRQAALGWAEELESLPHEGRVAKQMRARSRFRGAVFAAICLERAQAAIPAAMENSRSWAYLGQFATMHPDCETYPELEALALAYQSNACRASGNFEAAKVYMDMARSQMRSHGVMNLEATARIFSMEAALQIDIRHFPTAAKLLDRADTLYRLISQPEDRAKVLLQKATCHYYSGQHQLSISATHEALVTLPANAEPRLMLCARHNHATYLCALDRYEEALAILEEGLPLYASFKDEATQVRLAWLKGKIAFGHGALDTAERLFEETRASYQHQKQPYDAALVSLDLALVYAEQLRTDELRALTDEMVHTFTRYELHHEAVAALILLKQTVYAERALTVSTVRRLARFLEQERSHLRPRKRTER